MNASAELRKLAERQYAKRHKKVEFVPGQSRVPSSAKLFDAEELYLMMEAVLDGWWTEGRFVDELNEKLAKYIGVQFCSVVNSGSSANLLAYAALSSPLLGEKRIRPGDEVITVAAGFPTTVNPILQHGGVPVFVDIDPMTLGVKMELLEAARSSKTKAVMLAHALGNPFMAREIREWCDEHGLWLIEDNCDSMASTYEGKRTGGFGHISTCSFYPAHHISTGEGGAVLTDDQRLWQIMRSLAQWGRDAWHPRGIKQTTSIHDLWDFSDLPSDYEHTAVYSGAGYNLKMGDVQAACGVAQLGKLDEFVKTRRKNFKMWQQKLAQYGEWIHGATAVERSEPCWFGFPIYVKAEAPFTREDLLNYLFEHKIEYRLFFAGNLVKQPYMKMGEYDYRVVGELTGTNYVMARMFWLGVYPGITEEMIDYTVGIVGEFIESKVPRKVAASATV